MIFNAANLNHRHVMRRIQDSEFRINLKFTVTGCAAASPQGTVTVTPDAAGAAAPPAAVRLRT